MFAFGAVQNRVNRVDLVKSFHTNISMQKSASIQPRTSLEVMSFIYIHSPPPSHHLREDQHEVRRGNHADEHPGAREDATFEGLRALVAEAHGRHSDAGLCFF